MGAPGPLHEGLWMGLGRTAWSGRAFKCTPRPTPSHTPHSSLCPHPTHPMQAFADIVGGALATMNLGWMPLFGLLHFAFFFLHYMFASQVGPGSGLVVPASLGSALWPACLLVFGSLPPYCCTKHVQGVAGVSHVKDHHGPQQP